MWFYFVYLFYYRGGFDLVKLKIYLQIKMQLQLQVFLDFLFFKLQILSYLN